jgi:hypothetical protein
MTTPSRRNLGKNAPVKKSPTRTPAQVRKAAKKRVERLLSSRERGPLSKHPSRRTKADNKELDAVEEVRQRRKTMAKKSTRKDRRNAQQTLRRGSRS